MKKRISALSALLLALSLLTMTGCDSKNNSDSTDNTSKPASSISTSDVSNSSETEKSDTNTAVISIKTINQAEDVMKFVLEPVSRHVAESIASWAPDFVIPPEPYYEDCIISVRDKNGNETFSDAEGKVKVRGNWTSVYPKKPLKINFSKKQSMIGLNNNAEMKNWLLLAEYKDASMLRDKAAFSLAKGIYESEGLYAADADFAEVTVNGEYLGLYLLTEMQQINENRVNITKAPKDYTGTDIGYLLEMDGYFTDESELQSFHVDYADNAALVPYNGKTESKRTMKCLPASENDYKKDIGFTIVNTMNSKEQHDFIANFTNNVYKIMYEAAYNNKAYRFDENYSSISEADDISPQEAVENVVNVKSLADTYILNEIVCDADIYWSSFYMDADFGTNGNKKLTFEAPWDFDSALGNKDRCSDGTGFYAANIVPDADGGPDGNGEYNTINPWLAVLANTDWFQDIVKTKWTELYDNGIFTKVTQILKNDSDYYKAAFEKNYQKWDNIVHNEAFVNELSEGAAKCKTEEEAAQYLIDWLNSRIEFLNSEWHK